MKLLQLPLWNFFKHIWESEYKYLTFDTDYYWMCVFLSVCILAFIGLVGWIIYEIIYSYIDYRTSTKETLSAQLIDKKYIGEQSSSGVGTAVIPNTSGGVGIGLVSTSSHSDEEFLFFVKADKVYKVKVDMQQFYDSSIGDKLRLEVTTGGISKAELEVELAH